MVPSRRPGFRVVVQTQIRNLVLFTQAFEAMKDFLSCKDVVGVPTHERRLDYDLGATGDVLKCEEGEAASAGRDADFVEPVRRWKILNLLCCLSCNRVSRSGRGE